MRDAFVAGLDRLLMDLRRPALLRLGQPHDNLAAAGHAAMELFNRVLGFRLASHLDKPESAGAAPAP